MPEDITQPNLLVVEGKDEENLFRALIKHLELQEIQVMGIGGKTTLRPNLRALTSSTGFIEVNFLGIVRDANTDPNAAFQSVQDALRDVNLPIPEHTLVHMGDSPRVAIMILPEESEPGMLEDVCLKAVEEDPAMICVEEFFQCLENRNVPSPRNLSKAKVQAFLSSREEAGKRLGEAARYWPWDDQAFDQIREFLQGIVP